MLLVLCYRKIRSDVIKRQIKQICWKLVTFDIFDDAEMLDISTFWILHLLVELVFLYEELLIVIFFQVLLKALM